MRKWLHRLVVVRRRRRWAALALLAMVWVALALQERPKPEFEVLGFERKVSPAGEEYVAVAVRLRNTTGGPIAYYAHDRERPIIEAIDARNGRMVSGWCCSRGREMYELAKGEEIETKAALFKESARCHLQFDYSEAGVSNDVAELMAGLLPRKAGEWLREKVANRGWTTARSTAVQIPVRGKSEMAAR